MTGPNVLPLVKLPRPPADLAAKPIWLCWNLEPHEDPAKKARKVPYYTSGRRRAGKQGSPEDRAELSTFDHALRAATKLKMSGVGVALLPDLGLAAADFDNVVDQHGVIRGEVLDATVGTYAELSPSQRGVRAFYRGDIRSMKSFASAGHPFDVEFFGDSGFVTFTGNVLPTCAMLGDDDVVAPFSGPIAALYEARSGSQGAPTIYGGAAGGSMTQDPLMTYEPRLELTVEQMREALTRCNPSMAEPDWCKVLWAIHHETGGSEAGRVLAHEWSSGAYQADGPCSKYEPEAVDSRWQRAGPQRGSPVTFRSVLKLAGQTVPRGTGQTTPPDPAAVAAKALKFRFMPFSEFVTRAPPSWIIKGILPRAGLAMIYGESGSGKSFIALEFAAAIATGRPWRERRTERRRVAYLCAEGAGGFRNRGVAYASDNDLAPVALDDLLILDKQPNLLTLEDASALIESVKQTGASVVFIDTLAQVSVGANENAGEDMGRVLGHCRMLHEETGATVVLIHHAGKDLARGARGWSGIKAACDAEIEINRADEQRWMRISKMKDGEDGLEFGFRLQRVVLGLDDHGDEVTSCVVRDAQVAPRVGPRGEYQEIVFDLVSEFTGLTGGLMARNHVLKEAAERAVQAGNDSKVARAGALRGLRDLVQKGLLVENNDQIGVPG